MNIRMRNSIFSIFLTVVMIFAGAFAASAKGGDKKSSDKVVVAYVTSWSRVMPDPQYMTHINYAFGHVTKSFDGVRIDNQQRLHSITALKKQYPHLKVMLSVGGWASGNFSEMVADKHLRRSFAKDCKRVMKEYNLDGIDIDFEIAEDFENASQEEKEKVMELFLESIDSRKNICYNIINDV